MILDTIIDLNTSAFQHKHSLCSYRELKFRKIFLIFGHVLTVNECNYSPPIEAANENYRRPDTYVDAPPGSVLVSYSVKGCEY